MGPMSTRQPTFQYLATFWSKQRLGNSSTEIGTSASAGSTPMCNPLSPVQQFPAQMGTNSESLWCRFLG